MSNVVGLIGAGATVLVVVAGAGIAWLAYSPKFKRKHEEDGMIPFLDSAIPPEEQAEMAKKSRT